VNERSSSSKGGCSERSLNVNGLSREGLKAIFGGVVVGGWWLVVDAMVVVVVELGRRRSVKWEAGQSS
jgi:hypothetical protein